MNDFKASNEIIIGQTLVDWFTVTAWADGDSWTYWDTVLETHEIGRLPDGEMRVMQYEGWAMDVRNGSLFMGSGDQNGRLHNMVRSGGGVSNALFGVMCARPCANLWAKCTRLDLQLTLEQPDEWSQWKLFNRLKRSGQNVNFISSRSGKNMRELATVYIGSRHSSRLVRIYQKEALKGDLLLLRFEVEFKGSRSNQMAKAMNEDMNIANEYLLHDIQLVRDAKLEQLFGQYLSAYDPNTVRVRKVQAQDATESWLLGRVLPSFERHINAHDSSDIVLKNFLRVIQERLGQA